MARRDWLLVKLPLLVLLVLFSRLLTHPSLIPGDADIYAYHYPLRHLVASTLQEGRLPFWNPYLFAGMPLSANSQALLFYPAALLHYFFPLSWALSADAFLHLALALLGGYLLCRKTGVESAGALLLSTAYAFSPFLVYRLAQGVPTHLSALAWIPWVWLAAGSGRPLLLALALALQGLSGHPQFALINALALVLWALARRPRALAVLASGGLLALALAGLQALPTWSFLSRSVRAHWDPSFTLAYSFSVKYLRILLDPGAFGTPRDPAFAFYPSEFFEMLSLHMGLIMLPLALAGLFRKDRAAALWLLIAAGFFLALGQNNPAYAWMQKAFRLDFLRVPARFSLLILWSLWLSAAGAWRDWLQSKPAWLRLALGLLLLAELAVWDSRWVYALEAPFLEAQPAIAERLRQAPRIATAPDVSPNKTQLYRVRNATGYEAFYPAPIAFYTARSEKAAAADGSRTYIRRWLTPEMSALSVGCYVSPRPLPGREPAAVFGSTHLYYNPNALALVRGAEAWEELDPEHWVLRASPGSTPVLSHAADPGWTAWRSGKRLSVLLEDGFFPRIEAPPEGPSAIHWKFVPTGWRTGLLLSLISWLWLASRGFLACRF